MNYLWERYFREKCGKWKQSKTRKKEEHFDLETADFVGMIKNSRKKRAEKIAQKKAKKAEKEAKKSETKTEETN